MKTASLFAGCFINANGSTDLDSHFIKTKVAQDVSLVYIRQMNQLYQVLCIENRLKLMVFSQQMSVLNCAAAHFKPKWDLDQYYSIFFPKPL